MKEYDVKITETLEKTVTVEAKSRADAEEQVRTAYYNSEYILDSENFTGVEFGTTEEREIQQEQAETMTVLLVKPYMYPQQVQIGCDLEDLQKAVGGDIEAVYPFNEPVALVMHDEGKIMGKDLNRALRDGDGEIYDIIAGDFLVVGLGEEDFSSLSPELMKQFEEHFHQPETFVRMGRSIMALPLPDDTLNSEGRVWFSAYVFGQRRDGHYEKARTQNLKVDKAVAERIMSAFSAYFSNEYTEIFATDIGDWNMELTNTEGKTYKFRGSLCSEFEVQGIDLSDLLRHSLDMPDLYVFDGNNKPDIVNRIEVFYHRITKIKPKEPISEHTEYAVWDYTESLIIDRNSESIEHIQNIGTGCSVTRRYKVEGGIESLLDDLDIDILFEHIEGNPPDVVENPLESKDYTIKVVTKKGISSLRIKHDSLTGRYAR